MIMIALPPALIEIAAHYAAPYEIPAPPAQAQPIKAPSAPDLDPAPDSGTPDTSPTPDSRAEIIVEARPNASPGDPLEAVNAQSFSITQDVDRAVIGPVSHAYEHTLPEPVRDGIRNFQHNFGEPIIFLNFLFQHKIGKAAETVGRFALNTTVGIGGVFDVARKKPVNLPHRPNGFADTLGFYGVKPGPFLFLPIVGPTTVRDLVGGALDAMVMPRAIGRPVNTPPYAVAAGVLRSLNDRVEFDQKLNQLRDESPSPYTALRDYYLQRRQAEIDESTSSSLQSRAGHQRPFSAGQSSNRRVR